MLFRKELNNNENYKERRHHSGMLSQRIHNIYKNI